MPAPNNFTNPIFPVEIFREILQLYFTEHYHGGQDIINKPQNRRCAPTLVSKTFFELCRPLRLRKITGLRLDPKPTESNHLDRVIKFFERNPEYKVRVREIGIYIQKSRYDFEQVERNLRRLLIFPNIDRIMLMLESSRTQRNQGQLEAGMRRFLVSLGRRPEVKIVGRQRAYLMPYLRDDRVCGLSFEMCTGMYMNQKDVTPRSLPQVTSFELVGAGDLHFVEKHTCFPLSSLVLLPKLQSLVLNRFTKITDVPFERRYAGSNLNPSFDLRELDLSSWSGEEMQAVLDLYQDFAYKKSVHSFAKLETLNIEVFKEEFPALRVVRLLDSPMPCLHTLVLSWPCPGSDAALSDTRELFDKVAFVVTSGGSPIKNLRVCAPTMPDNATCTEALELIVDFLAVISGKNTIEKLGLWFVNELSDAIVVVMDEIYPLRLWGKIADLLKCAENFPALRDVYFNLFRYSALKLTSDDLEFNFQSSKNRYVTSHLDKEMGRLSCRPDVRVNYYYDYPSTGSYGYSNIRETAKKIKGHLVS